MTRDNNLPSAKMDQQDPIQFFRDSIDQIEPILCRHSVSMLERLSPKSYDEPSSGTLVQIRQRYFVMTAGHVIPRDPNSGNLWLLTKTPRDPFSDGLPEFLRFKKLAWPDVGYLELSKEVVEEYVDAEPCGIEKLCCRGVGRERRHVAIVGGPSDYAKPVTADNLTEITVVTKAYLSVPYSKSDWPLVAKDSRPASEEVDVFLPFESGDIQDIRTGQDMPLDSPKGYSGGGIWDMAFEPGEVWNSSDMCIFAVQSSFHGESNYMRAVQVHNWLRLIFDDYEDCREEIVDRFPEQFSLPDK